VRFSFHFRRRRSAARRKSQCKCGTAVRDCLDKHTLSPRRPCAPKSGERNSRLPDGNVSARAPSRWQVDAYIRSQRQVLSRCRSRPRCPGERSALVRSPGATTTCNENRIRPRFAWFAWRECWWCGSACEPKRTVVRKGCSKCGVMAPKCMRKRGIGDPRCTE
jgi:hypothetical protein